jgi:GR25 family glycosyltransferase involved in LPS biosynthesis
MLRRAALFRAAVSGSVAASSSPYPFDAVFVLNLKRRPDRWAHVQRQMQRARLPPALIERVEGVDGTTLDPSTLVRDGVISPLGAQRLATPAAEKLFGMDLTPGAVGCALGHRALWQRVVDRGCKCALLLEDDVEFHPQMPRTFAERWSHVPRDWGLVYLGGLDLLSQGKPPRPFLADGVRYAYEGHRELTAYVVHAASAARCLELTTRLTWQVDTHICNQLKDDPVAGDRYIADPLSYVLQPALAIQVTKLGTDVQKEPEAQPALADSARRMREFVGGGTSVR